MISLDKQHSSIQVNYHDDSLIAGSWVAEYGTE